MLPSSAHRLQTEWKPWLHLGQKMEVPVLYCILVYFEKTKPGLFVFIVPYSCSQEHRSFIFPNSAEVVFLVFVFLKNGCENSKSLQ